MNPLIHIKYLHISKKKLIIYIYSLNNKNYYKSTLDKLFPILQVNYDVVRLMTKSCVTFLAVHSLQCILIQFA